MKITFIYPNIGFNRIMLVPNGTFTTLASLIPPHWEVQIRDAGFQAIDFDEQTDIVGFTATISNVKQVYCMAAEFKKRGVLTLMGGPFATLYPEDVLQHVDVVFVGEAERALPKFLLDYESGRWQNIYAETRAVAGEEIPIPRRELLDASGYAVANTVAATRGCANRCNFCTVKNIYPYTHYTTRPVKNVVEEIETSFIGSRLQKKYFLFIEDNIISNREYAVNLFSAIRPLGKKWFSLAPMNMADDSGLLRLAADSGCRGIEVGLESFNPEVLKAQHKTTNRVEKYKEQINIFHDHGISIQAIMIFGFDQDSPDVFKRALDILLEIDVDIFIPLTLIPYPGTESFTNLEKNGRILTRDWDKYNGAHVVYQPQGMSPSELTAGCLWLVEQFYSVRNIIRRLPKELLHSWYSLPCRIATGRQLKQKFRSALSEE